MTVPEMEANANIFMIAGTETTATALSGLVFYLLKNPAKLAKLQAEIRTSFSGPADFTFEKLQAPPYLQACLEEGLRIYPPVPTGLPRLTPKGGLTIDGVHVPGGVSVSVSQYSANRSGQNFALPDEFHPERWIDGGGGGGRDARFVDDNRAALQPFSLGARNCIGRNLAYHEARLLLVSVLYDFDLELDPRSEDWHRGQAVYSLWEKVPLWVKLRQRTL